MAATDAAEIAALLTQTLEARAAAESGARATLVSFSFELIAAPAAGRVEAGVTRQTRTLLFLHAELIDAQGARIATAASVHKLAHES